ncbi:conserved hypothetical protein, partial [Ricinus communis]
HSLAFLLSESARIAMQDIHRTRRLWALPLTCIAALLSACGSSTDTAATSAQTAAPLATATTILQLNPGTLPSADAQQFALPAYHMAPVLLDTPADATPGADAGAAVHTQTVPSQFRRLDSRRLTVEALRQVQALRSATSEADADTSSAAPLASTTTVATYTPAQIRAAYGLPTLPASFTGLSAAQAAQLGAGQTIYIVDAQHNPN